MKLDSRQIQKLAQEYPRIPLCKEIYGDLLTPIGVLKKLETFNQNFYLLESMEGQEKWGRYSFLGYDPVMRVRCKDQRLTVEEDGGIKEVQTADPMEYLRKILTDFRSPKLSGLPPFTGGFVGYFGYSMIGYAEPVLHLKKGEFPDLDLMLFDKVIAFDHLRQKILLVVNMKTEDVLENYGEAQAELEKMAAMLHTPLTQKDRERSKASNFTCNMSQEEYSRLVEKTKEYIREGDIFQAVISRQFSCIFAGDLMDAYRVLRTTNPSPYMVYLHMDDMELMSTSPETLVRLENGRLTTFPVAGSRPRGRDEAEDAALEVELLKDDKELAEHNMLVDLGRNDLGRISRFGSVEVTKYQMVHKYSKVMHICSQVEGEIRPDKDALDAIASVLPAGTLSGAPKIRACEIIEELEPLPRNIYGGALGYVDFTGNMDTCIAIRMAVKKDGRVYVQAGGGIVADSVPQKEYEESANKAMAVMQAVEQAGEVE
ncbi:MAG: anthranilate synthase component I [Blautia sp.]|jgi:anthranilate synthase component 1